MTTIKEVLQKQADAIRANFESLKKAEQLEKQAKALREKANRPVMADLKAIGRAKVENLSRFSNAMHKGRDKAIEDLLKQNGWIPAMKTKGEARFGIKAAPGYSLKIKGNKFSVNYHNEEKQQALEVDHLEAYLLKFKKDLK